MRFYTKMTYILSTLSYSNIKLARSLAVQEQLATSVRENEEKYRFLFENAPAGIISVDKEGHIVEVNQSLLEILGSPSHEVTKSINMFELPQLVQSGISESFRSCIASGKRLTKEIHIIANGGRVPT